LPVEDYLVLRISEINAPPAHEQERMPGLQGKSGESVLVPVFVAQGKASNIDDRIGNTGNPNILAVRVESIIPRGVELEGRDL
jgi:hypothetical protein